MSRADAPLRAGDERLPAVRARLFLLVRSLWKAGMVQVPLTLEPSDVPSFHLLHPLWQRLRVELLGEQLLRDILPAIERHLASEGDLRREESTLTPNAPVDWPATWRRGLGRPADAPLVTRRWERNLHLPENYLAHRALRALAQDSDVALHSATSPEEAAPLRRLREQASRRLQRPPWHSFRADDGEVLLREASERIRRALPQRPAYGPLLAWWQQWQNWQQPSPGNQPLLDPALEPDWLFELLFLFELVAALAQHFPIRQGRALGGRSRAPVFIAQSASGPLMLHYQSGSMFSGQRSLAEIGAIPDIVLQLPGAEPQYVILDAKNYGSSGHTQAIYKMMGYLYQFGYDPAGEHRFEQTLAAILAFPTAEREGEGLRHWQREMPGGQSVMSFVLPPLPDERFTGLNEVVAWLLARV
ncbi:MAG: hypothetical protein H0T73_11595 [Ardenticatenales bacterium]|nr:hypothetical protein [Ardenticatenales bacterium]